MRTSARPSASTWSLAALLIITTVAATGARADSPTDEAHTHVDRAHTHYQLGRFSEALTEYAKAYELFPAAALLFNLGQCHRGLGDCPRAVFSFEGYLRAKPDAPNRALVEDLIAECRRAIEKEEVERRASGHSRRGSPIFRRWWFWTAVAVAVVAATATGLGYYYSGGTTRTLPAGSAGTLDRRGP